MYWYELEMIEQLMVIGIYVWAFIAIAFVAVGLRKIWGLIRGY